MSRVLRNDARTDGCPGGAAARLTLDPIAMMKWGQEQGYASRLSGVSWSLLVRSFSVVECAVSIVGCWR